MQETNDDGNNSVGGGNSSVDGDSSANFGVLCFQDIFSRELLYTSADGVGEIPPEQYLHFMYIE